MPTTTVTVIVPCFNEVDHIEACLRDLFEQDYPADLLDVVVADGMSTDGTRAVLAELAGRWPQRLRLIDNPQRVQAAALAAMVPLATGDVIVRADVHARYAPDYVRQCVAVGAATGADNVGGAMRPLAGTRFQQALCRALDSRLGVGNAGYRDAEREGWVDTVFLGAFRRDVFTRFGNFDPCATPNEDAELNQRILQGGGRIYLSRAIVVHYVPRSSLRALARQYFRYGKGRARTALKHRRLPTVRPLLPFGLVVGGALLVVTSRWQPFTRWVAAAYATACLAEAVRVSRQGTPVAPSSVPTIAAIFPVMHVCHGVGFAAGLVRYGLRPDWKRILRWCHSEPEVPVSISEECS